MLPPLVVLERRRLERRPRGEVAHKVERDVACASLALASGQVQPARRLLGRWRTRKREHAPLGARQDGVRVVERVGGAEPVARARPLAHRRRHAVLDVEPCLLGNHEALATHAAHPRPSPHLEDKLEMPRMVPVTGLRAAKTPPCLEVAHAPVEQKVVISNSVGR